MVTSDGAAEAEGALDMDGAADGAKDGTEDGIPDTEGIKLTFGSYEGATDTDGPFDIDGADDDESYNCQEII